MKRHPSNLAAAALLLLAGWVTSDPLPVVTFDHAAAPVHSIAIVTPAVPEKPVLISLAPVTAAPAFLGLPGMEIERSAKQEHAAHFAAIGRGDHPPAAYDYDRYADFGADHASIVSDIREGMHRAATAVVAALQ